jgi:hypothetical protein
MLNLKSKYEDVAVNLTQKCNLNCKTCNQIVSKGRLDFITKEDYSVIKKSLKSINIRSIGLTGGEPLLHPDFEWIVENLNADFPEVNLTLITNGLLLHRVNLNILKKFKQISISYYQGINDTAIKNFIFMANVYSRNANNHYNPLIIKRNNRFFSHILNLLCPMKKLFIVGLNVYTCCLSEVSERIFNVNGLHVRIDEKNWYKKYKRISTEKACSYCSFAELNRLKPIRFYKTLIQKFKILLISLPLFYKFYFLIFKLRKRRLLNKTGLLSI